MTRIRIIVLSPLLVTIIVCLWLIAAIPLPGTVQTFTIANRVTGQPQALTVKYVIGVAIITIESREAQLFLCPSGCAISLPEAETVVRIGMDERLISISSAAPLIIHIPTVRLGI